MKKVKDSQLLYSADENPPHGTTAFMGLQYILLILAPITMTPLVVVRAAGLDIDAQAWVIFASLIASAITSYVQIHRVGKVGTGYLLFMGTSGAFIAVAISAAEIGGLALLATLCILSAPFQILFAMKLGWFRKIITPAVGGVVIILIVVAIMPAIASMLKTPPNSPVSNYTNLTITAVTFITIIGLAVLGNAKMRLWSPLVGLFAGTIIAWLAGAMSFEAVRQASWIGLPNASLPGLDLSFPPEFLGLYLSFILVTLVGAIETYGDAIAVQRISEREKKPLDYRKVQGAIYTDGIGNAMAGAIGTIPNTSYSIGISAVELTGVASRRVGTIVCCALGLLAFMPKLAALLMSIPGPVFSAFFLILLSMLIKIGLKLCAEAGFSTENGYIVGVSFILGYGAENQMFFPELISGPFQPFLVNGMAVGGTTAVILSLLFTLRVKGKSSQKLKPELASIQTLHKFVDKYANARSLSEQTRFKLNLAAEESFTYLLNNRPVDTGDSEMILKIGIVEHNILVEMIDGSDAEQMAEIDTDDLRNKADDLDPEAMGLVLLDGLVENLHCQKYGAVNYLSFTISQD